MLCLPIVFIDINSCVIKPDSFNFYRFYLFLNTKIDSYEYIYIYIICITEQADLIQQHQQHCHYVLYDNKFILYNIINRFV